MYSQSYLYIIAILYLFMSCKTSNKQCKDGRCCKMLWYACKVLVIFVLIALSFWSWNMHNEITKLKSQIANQQSTQANA